MSNINTPYTFSNATVANATEVNSNFAEIADALNSRGLDSSGLAANSVTTAKITDLNVTADKLSANAVTTAKILDGAVTQAKRASLGQQLSSSCGTFTTTSSSYVDVTNLSVSITTTGRPVMLLLIPDGDTIGAYVSSGNSTVGSSALRLKFLRDATDLGIYTIDATVNTFIAVPVGSISYVDVPAAGTYTYKLQARRLSGSVASEILKAKLLAYEL